MKAHTPQKCPRCNDDGLYTVLPRGNPFALDIFTLASRLEARICHCVVGRSLAEYRDFDGNRRAAISKASTP